MCIGVSIDPDQERLAQGCVGVREGAAAHETGN